MGSAVSTDNSKNVTDTLNTSTLTQVKKRDVSCAQKVEQFQNNELENIKTGGGDLTITQYAGIISNCVLTSNDKENLINDIAADVAQKIKTDKGAAATFSLVSVNDQENTNKISQVLNQNYEDVSGLKCDIDVLQSQQNKLRNIDTGGGNITVGQTSNVQSDCSLIASVNRNAATSLASKVDQTSETTIPSFIYYIIGGLVLIALIGAIAGIIYAFAGDDAPERRRRFASGISANFPQQPLQTQYGGSYADPYAGQQQPLLAEPQYVVDPSQIQLQ